MWAASGGFDASSSAFAVFAAAAEREARGVERKRRETRSSEDK